MKVDKEVKEILTNWADRLPEKSLEDLEREFEIRSERVAERNNKMDANDVKINTIALMRTLLQASLRTNAPVCQGMVFGGSEPNQYLVRRAEANKGMYDDTTTRKMAIEGGKTNDKGEPLDDRKKFNSGNTNKDYGKVFSEIKYGIKGIDKKGKKVYITYEDKMIQNIYGIMRKKNTDEIKPFVILRNDLQCEKPLPNPDEVVEFRANITEEKDDIFILSWSNSTVFKPIEDEDDLIDFDMDELLEGEIENLPLTDLDELEEFHDRISSLPEKEKYNHFVFTKGRVSNINLEKEYNNSFDIDKPMDTDDDDNWDFDYDDDDEDVVASVPKVYLPKTVPIEFAEGTLIYVFGQTMRQFTKNDEGEDTPGQINIRGFNFIIPDGGLVTQEDLDVANQLASDSIDDEDGEYEEEYDEEDEDDDLLDD